MKERFSHIVIFLLLLFSQALPAIARHAPDSVACERAVDYYYLQALSFMGQEKYDAAFELLEHCRALSPSSSPVLYELVNMYQFLGRKDLALEILKKIVREEPQNYNFWLSLVEFYDNDSQGDEALKVWEKMAVVFPDRSDVFLYLAARYADRARYAESIAALEKYESIEGRSELVTMQKYRIYVILQQRDKALAEIKSLACEYPDDLRMRAIEADTYYLFDEKEKALDIYHDILEQAPDNVTAQQLLAKHYKEEGNDSLYVRHVEQLLKNEKFSGSDRLKELSAYISYRENIDSAGSYAYVTKFLDELMALPYGVLETATIYNLYLSYSEKGEEEQLPILNKILSIEPDNRVARVQKLHYAIEHNDYEAIIAECDTAIMYYPETLDFYHYRGLACYFTGNKEEAIENYKRGLEKCSPETNTDFISSVYAQLGDTYHETGMIEESMQAYESSLAYNSTNIVVLNNYAYYLALENRNLDRALEMSYHTIKAEPDEPIYIDTYAWILFLLQRYDEAKEYADRLMSAEGEKSAVELHHCGDIYSKSGEIEKALDCWIKAQEMGDDSKILKRKIKKRKYIPNGKKK